MPSPTPLSAACNTFSLSLFKKLSENNITANVFYSPISISSAVAMVLLGARGNTAKQMSQVLHFKDDVHMEFPNLMGDLNKSGKSYALSLVNRLYGEKSYQFLEEFLSATRKHFDAQLEPVDFIGNAEGARLNMNSWVEKQTQDKIKDLLAPGAVDSNSRLVLVNAIYFKAKWDQSFHEYDIINNAPFSLSKTECMPVKMMNQCSVFPFAAIPEVRCQVLELPYKGECLSMLIILPLKMEDNTTGLEKLEKELSYEKFVEWTNPGMMDRTMVWLLLPCFKMEETYDMKDILIKMGMEDAFDEKQSDFSGISPANSLFLSKVVHKAVVEVNEGGTEAAASTYECETVEEDCEESDEEGGPPIFYANHPFLFFIRHNPTMSILFAGRYCSPP